MAVSYTLALGVAIKAAVIQGSTINIKVLSCKLQRNFASFIDKVFLEK